MLFARIVGDRYRHVRTLDLHSREDVPLLVVLVKHIPLSIDLLQQIMLLLSFDS